MTELEMIEQIEILEHEENVLDQLKDLKTVLDIYEGKHETAIYESEYISRFDFPVMSESEILKCSKYLAGGRDIDKLKERLTELNLHPKTVYNINIHYVNAKKRYDNLKAFYELRFKKL